MGYAIGGLVAVAVILLILNSARRSAPVDQQTGDLLLATTRWVMLLGWIAIAIGAVIGIGIATSENGNLWAGVAFGGFFVIAGGALVLEGSVRLRVRPDGFDSWSPWRGARSMRWEDIATVTFSRINKWFVITDRDGKKVRVSIFMRGLPDFADTLELNVGPVAEAAVDVYSSHGSLL